MFKELLTLKNRKQSFLIVYLSAALLINLTFLFISGFLAYTISQKILTGSAFNYTQSIMNQAITNVDSYINDRVNLLKSLANNSYIRRSLEAYQSMDIYSLLETENKYSGYVKSIMQIKPDLYDVLIVGNNSYIYNLQTRWDIDPKYDFTSASWYKKALEYDKEDPINISVMTLDFYMINTPQYMKKSVIISMPVYNYLEEKIGVVFFLMRMDEMTRNVLTGNYKEFGDIYLIDRDYSIIAHTDYDVVGKYFNKSITLTNLDNGIINNIETQHDNYLWASLDSRYSDCRAICRISLGYIRGQTSTLYILILFCLLAGTVLNVLLFYVIYKNLHNSMATLIQDMDSVQSLTGVLPRKHYKYIEFNNIAIKFDDLIERLKKMSRENYEIQLSLNSAKLDTMTSQLNPHFLFNTLQLLQTEIVYGSTEVSNRIVISLGNLFRYSTAKTAAMVKIMDEINFTRDYLSIYQIIYSSNLSINFNIDERILNHTAPKFTIQPLVENSIKHGFSGTPYKNHISITGRLTDYDIIFTIEDDGIGMSNDHLTHLREILNSDINLSSGSGIGLKNIHNRIKILFGAQYGLNIESEANSFTRITLLIPRIGDASQP